MEKIFETLLPNWKGVALPKEFPSHVRLTLRASVLIAHAFSLRCYLLPFHLLSENKRAVVMEKIYNHPNAVIRNIAQFWKVTAFMTNAD